MASFLDSTGLSHLIEKIKATFIAKSDTIAATTISIDSTPTANSTNLVTSGGVKAALDNYTETDPTVPAWAKASTKPTYTATEVGALPDTTVIPDDSNLVHKTGEETIEGLKRFYINADSTISIGNGEIKFETAGLNKTNWNWISYDGKGTTRDQTLQQALDARNNVQADWNQTTTTAADYIKNKPTIPAAQIQADWNQTTTTSLDYIKNKPYIKSKKGGEPDTMVTKIGQLETDDWDHRVEINGNYFQVYTDDNGHFLYNNKEVAVKDDIPTTYAASASAGGAALKTGSIPFGIVDSTSTATVFTATVPGITELTDGTCVLLKNGVVTSASGFTLNINGLGAHPAFSNMTAATAETTIFNINYTMLFVYDSTRVVGSHTGAWCCYRGYDANTNTIGYQIRGNSASLPCSDRARYYKIYFTSADGTMWVPASSNWTNDATASKVVNQRPINPFGPIVYTSANTNYTAGAILAVASAWQQYALTLGHSFNRTGAALTLTTSKSVYVKCAPQSNGSAIIDSTTPIVQDLPSTEDGKIYIFLGIAYSATNIELKLEHPVFYYKDGAIRLWTNAAASSSGSVGTLNTNNTSAQTVSSSESLSGTINLHKVAKTGSFTDLINKPYIYTLQTTTVPNVTSVGSASTWNFTMGTGNDEHTLIISGGNGTSPSLGTAIEVATGNTDYYGVVQRIEVWSPTVIETSG